MVYRYWKKHQTLPNEYDTEGLAQNVKILATNDLQELKKDFKKKDLPFPTSLNDSNLSLGIKNSKKELQTLTTAMFGPYFSAQSQECDVKACSIDIRIVDSDLKRLVEASGGTYYSAYEHFCNDQGCLNRIPGTENALTTLDQDHITPAAARYLVQGVNQKIPLQSMGK
jgi:hypothetical protein